MREYSVVTPAFWIGDTGKALRGDKDAQLLAMYLMTSPHSNTTGVFHCPILYMAHEIGLPLEGATEALARLIEAGFCEYEGVSETVFVVRMATFQIASSLKLGDNRILRLKKALSRMASPHMRSRFIAIYSEAFCLNLEAQKTSPLQAPPKPRTRTRKTNTPIADKSAKSPVGFDQFWKTWPTNERKQAKGQCLRAWTKARAEDSSAQILAHVQALKKNTAWLKDDGQYVPAPLLYLNQRRWEGADIDDHTQPNTPLNGLLPGAI